MKKPMTSVLGGAALVLLFTAGHASATLLISNHPGNDGSQTFGINASSRTKGMGFTMPGGIGYFLDEVVLRLDITDVNTTPVVEIFSSVGGVPGVSLTTLVAPGGYVFGIGDYSFTPANQFTLDPDTPYWIVASAANDAHVYNWKASSPAQTPTGLATHFGSTFGAYPPSNNSSIFTTYYVMGTLIPAPTSLALLGLGGLALRRRR